MTNEQDRSRLDAVIDDVVRNMMQVDARSDLAGRVLGAIDAPPHRPWFFGAPALAAASFAVLVLAATAMLVFGGADPVAVPSIEVAVGPPPGLATTTPAAPHAAQLPRVPAAPSSVAAATTESIFGPQRGQVGAANVRATPQVRLALVLSDRARDGQPLTQTLTMILTDGERRDGRVGTGGEPQLNVSATPEILTSGAIKLTVAVLAPVQ